MQPLLAGGFDPAIPSASVGLLGLRRQPRLPSLFPAQTQTTLPAATATQASNVQEIVLFSDDFSDRNSGWPTIRNDQGGYSYQSDGYHIFINEIDEVFWAKTDREDDNVSIYVDAKPLAESMNSYGLLCRIQDVVILLLCDEVVATIAREI
jgi:hypothetical protein